MAPPPLSGDTEALPFPAGTSPFRIKGISYRGHVDYVKTRIPGGEQAVVESFRDPGLRTFFGQNFLAASWYDVFPMVAVWHQCARLLQMPPIDFLQERTRHQALADIGGVYRFILKLVTAEAIALRVPRVVQQYLDFGATEASVVGPGVVRATGSGIPVFLVPWLRVVAETYLLVALELAGVKDVQLRWLPVVPEGEGHGVRLAGFGFEIQLRTGEG
jgi:hypothetical protein